MEVINSSPVAPSDFSVDKTKGEKINPINILSLSGGGVRGLIEATVLDKIEKITQIAVHDLFDIFAGTSTGSLVLSSLLVKNKNGVIPPANEVVTLFKQYAPNVFTESWVKYLTMQEFETKPKYDSSKLSGIVNQFAGDALFKDVQGNLCIPTWDMTIRKPYLFKVRDTKSNQTLANLKLSTILCGATAAPTYFSAKEINIGPRIGTFADGGIVTNNPSEIAYKEAQYIYGKNREFTMCSLNTGAEQFSSTPKENLDWGIAQWLDKNRIFDTFLQGSALGNQMLTEYDFNDPDKFLFCQPTITSSEDLLDNASTTNLTALEDTAKGWIEENEDTLKKFCSVIEKGREDKAQK